MYSEADLDNAVAGGALTAEAATQFRNFIAGQCTAPAVDEEYFRLVTGFNDIFVSIAIILVLAAVGTLSRHFATYMPGVAIATVSWGLAEYFTRQRRMALPSILLLLGFTGGIGFAALALIVLITGSNAWPGHGQVNSGAIALTALAAFIIGAASYLHWRRFKVPITIAAGAAAAIFFFMMLLLAMFPAMRHDWQILLLLCGFAVFALALRWDMTDRTRTTRRADVAFWLHLLAAPLIVHPLFAALGLLNGGDGNLSRALMAIGIYILLAAVALLVDRRALLVSALGYVIFAFSSVLKQAGAVGSDLAITALVAGAALLLLSAFWHRARLAILRLVPARLQQKLPAA